jgi:hypothetical protein
LFSIIVADMQTDFTTDEALAFLAPLKEASVIPDWLAGAPDAEAVKGLPSSSFADTGARLMPIHDKQAAWLSAVSSYAYGTPAGPWAERLKKACHAYGIVDSVKAAIEVLRPVENSNQKEAAAESPKIYGLTLDTADGPANFYRLDLPGLVEKSAREMHTDLNESRFPEAWIAKAARELMKVAAERGYPTSTFPATIVELGTERLPSPDYIDMAIAERQRAGIPEGGDEFYRKSAAMLCANEVSLEDAALVWELADRRFGIEGKCASPVKSLNSGMSVAEVEKIAKEVVLFRDQWIPLAAIQALPQVKVATLLNTKEAASVLHCCGLTDGREVSRILSTLDADSCRIVSDILTHDHAA